MNIIQSSEKLGRLANGVHLENCVIEFPWLTFTIKYHISGAVVANKLNGIWSESHICISKVVHLYEFSIQFPRYPFPRHFHKLYFFSFAPFFRNKNLNFNWKLMLWWSRNVNYIKFNVGAYGVVLCCSWIYIKQLHCHCHNIFWLQNFMQILFFFLKTLMQK